MADGSPTASTRSYNSSLPPTEPPASPPASPQRATTTTSDRTTHSNSTREVKRQQSDVDHNLAHEKDEESKGSGDDECSSDVDLSSLSSLSRTRTRVNLRDESSLRSQNENLSLIAARGCATWPGPNSRQPQRVDVFTDIYWEPIAKKAFFKLRTSLKLKNKRHRRHVSLFLCPERISSLSLDRIQHGEPPRSTVNNSMHRDEEYVENRHEQGPDVFTLRFNLLRQGALVLPNEFLEPKNKESADTLAGLRKLATQKCFSVHVRVPRYLLGMATRIRGLCAEISQGSISSIDTQADVTGVYRGHGAQVIEGDRLEEDRLEEDDLSGSVVDNDSNDDAAAADDTANDDTALFIPPAYEEAAYPSKQSSPIRRGKKRRRASSSVSVSAEAPAPTLVPSTAELAQPPPLYDGPLPTSLKHFVVETLAAQERKFNKALADQENKFRQELAAQKEEIDKMRKDMDRQYVYIDDAVEDNVGVHMEQTQETIMRSITRGQLRATVYIDSPEQD